MIKIDGNFTSKVEPKNETEYNEFIGLGAKNKDVEMQNLSYRELQNRMKKAKPEETITEETITEEVKNNKRV